MGCTVRPNSRKRLRTLANLLRPQRFCNPLSRAIAAAGSSARFGSGGVLASFVAIECEDFSRRLHPLPRTAAPGGGGWFGFSGAMRFGRSHRRQIPNFQPHLHTNSPNKSNYLVSSARGSKSSAHHKNKKSRFRPAIRLRSTGARRTYIGDPFHPNWVNFDAITPNKIGQRR